MTENPNEKEEYQFIKEQIVPKRKNKIWKKLGTTVFVICMAVVFGLVAQIVMLTSEDMLRELLGIEEGERQPVDLNRPSPSASPVLTPTEVPQPTQEGSTQTPGPTQELQETLAPTQTPEPTQGVSGTPVPTMSITPVPTEEARITDVPQITETPEITQTPGATENPEVSETPVPTPDALYTYLQVHQQILDIAEEVSSSLVVVEAIEEGVDWFQEIYVTRTRTSGLILANDGVDLLILVDIERISGANSIEVYFGEEIVSGRVYSLDKSYGLAVIAVPLNSLSEDILTQISIGMLAEEEDIRVGAPVIGLGAPNGYENSMEFGMVTSLGSTISVTDGQVSYFTTDINDQPDSYGFVVNLDGEIMGMITHTHKVNAEDGIFSAIALNAIEGVIVKLLNNEERAYFGIKGQDLPRSVMESSGLADGVYVSEVENASPALNSGIKAGDIIVEIGGQPVSGIFEFHDVLLDCSVREIVVVRLMRRAEDGMREMTVEVPLVLKN